jgi:hypothetical protein
LFLGGNLFWGYLVHAIEFVGEAMQCPSAFSFAACFWFGDGLYFRWLSGGPVFFLPLAVLCRFRARIWCCRGLLCEGLESTLCGYCRRCLSPAKGQWTCQCAVKSTPCKKEVTDGSPEFRGFFLCGHCVFLFGLARSALFTCSSWSCWAPSVKGVQTG